MVQKKRSKKGLKKVTEHLCFVNFNCMELWLANWKGTNLICKEQQVTGEIDSVFCPKVLYLNFCV